jgi:hypothetical protein
MSGDDRRTCARQEQIRRPGREHDLRTHDRARAAAGQVRN